MSSSKPSSGPPNLCGNHDVICKAIIGFMALSCYLIFQIIDITSRHYAVAFKIPVHNIGIYFDKLFSLRVLLILAGNMIEYSIFQGSGADRPDEKGDKNRGKRVRRYVSLIAFSALFCVRIWFLAGLYYSNELGYHVYKALSFEGLPFGVNDSAFMPLAAQYITVVSLMFNMTRIFIVVVQFILDRIWYDNPLLMIKIQAWICVLLHGCCIFTWYHYNFNLKAHTFDPPKGTIAKDDDSRLEVLEDNVSIFELIEHCLQPDEVKSEELKKKLQVIEEEKQKAKQQLAKSGCTNAFCEECKRKFGKDGINAVLIPLMMYWCVNPYMSFLFPGTLPYGLLNRDKCHRINMCIPFISMMGPLTYFFLDNFGKVFSCWSWHYDLFIILLIPFPILFTLSIMAMHTRIPAVKKIRNNRPRVMAMTLFMYFCNTYCDPLHFIGLAKYSFRGNPYGFTIQGLQKVVGGIGRSFFAKVSIGYSVTRISLGYHLPKFRPNHRMSKKNLGWYIFRQTFRKTWADFRGDLRLDIRKYL